MIKKEDAIRAIRESNDPIEAVKRLPEEDYMWACPECGLYVQNEFPMCIRCGHKRPQIPVGYISWKERKNDGRDKQESTS